MHNLSDKEQAQLLKDLWNKYGVTILLAIVVFMATNFSWRYFAQYKTNQQEKASILFTQMLNAQVQNKKPEAALFAENLMKNFASSSYSSFAAMMLAKDAINTSDLASAQTNLTWVVKHSGKKELSELAAVRLARVLIAENKSQDAINLLEKNTNALYLSAKHETMGDALMAQNKAKEAATFYQKAIANSTNNKNANETQDTQPTHQLLKMKAEQLGTLDTPKT